MSKSKMTVLDLCLCAMMVALHIVLETFVTIRIGESFKLTISALPFVVAGMLCGPVEGFVTGIVGSFLSQMLGPYGLMITTPIWIIPGAIEGLTSGLIFNAFRRDKKIVKIGISVFIADFIFFICNWFGSYLGDIIILKDMTIETLLGVTPVRLLKWVIMSIVYTLVIFALIKALKGKIPGDMRLARRKARASS